MSVNRCAVFRQTGLLCLLLTGVMRLWADSAAFHAVTQAVKGYIQAVRGIKQIALNVSLIAIGRLVAMMADRPIAALAGNHGGSSRGAHQDRVLP